MGVSTLWLQSTITSTLSRCHPTALKRESSLADGWSFVRSNAEQPLVRARQNLGRTLDWIGRERLQSVPAVAQETQAAAMDFGAVRRQQNQRSMRLDQPCRAKQCLEFCAFNIDLHHLGRANFAGG